MKVPTIFTKRAFSLDSSSQKTMINAISEVKSTIRYYRDYPNKPGKIKVMIATGGNLFTNQIPGELETKVKLKSANTYEVTFIEYWNSIDCRYKDSQKGMLSSFEIYKVKGDKIKFIKQGGWRPPETID